MTIAWVDATAGASGDMLLGALLDAGADIEAVRAAIGAIGVEPIGLHVSEVRRAGLRALHAGVVPTGHGSDGNGATRDWREVRALLLAAPLFDAVRESALSAFALLAEAEAHVHGIPVDDVHFHEAGALDAIADVVGVCAAVHDLGIDDLATSIVAVGAGSTVTRHGRLPVPVPAVVELLARAGLASQAGAVEHEACTPTGAALLAALARGTAPQPAMGVHAVGTGAGSRDPDGVANVVRVLVGEVVEGPAPTNVQVVLESNVDDLDPRLWPGVLEALLAAGADDAWLTPILMKKGRPAHTLHVLVPPDRLAAVRHTIIEHTTAIGMREHRVVKHPLGRDIRTVMVRDVPVRVKVAFSGDVVVNVMPEFDDVAAAARRLGIAAKIVLAEAVAAAHVGSTGTGAGPTAARP